MTKKEITARLNQEFDKLQDDVKNIALHYSEDTPEEIIGSCELIISQQRGLVMAANALKVKFEHVPADEVMVKLWRDYPQAVRR